MAAEWYYADQGQRRGPVTFEQLQQRAESGQLRPSDLVWKPSFTDWVPASTQPGLFGGAAPRAGRPREEFDDESMDDERRPRRVRRSSGGSGGMKIALFAGGGVLLLGCLCCGVVGVVVYATKGPSNERNWNLGTNQTMHWKLPFKQGDKVTINVSSTGNSDMDLYVFTDKTKMDQFLALANIDTPQALRMCLRFDNGPSKNCFVDFVASSTQDYWVLLINRNSKDEPIRNGKNSGKLVFEPAPK